MVLDIVTYLGDFAGNCIVRFGLGEKIVDAARYCAGYYNGALF
jgi:hypothetical protein